MKTNMVLICSVFYSIIKTAANSNQRHKIAGSTLCRAGKAKLSQSRGQLLHSALPRREVAPAEGQWPVRPAQHQRAPAGPRAVGQRGEQSGSPESSATPRAAEP